MTIVSLTTSARDGDVRPPRALQSFMRKREWPRTIATGKQIHKTRVEVVRGRRTAQESPDTDGFLTDQPLQPVGVYTADCLPVFVADLRTGVVGVLHAGWRGVQGRILEESVRRMRSEWGSRPQDIRFWLGPCIQPCCFEVQWDVARYFPGARRRRRDRWVLDMPKAIRRQARALGLREAHDKSNRACTMHDHRYFSFRRNATPKRQISIIFFKP